MAEARDVPDVGSWNIYRDNQDGLAGIKRGIRKMIDRGADVICLQELSNDIWWLQLKAWMEAQGWWVLDKNVAIATYVNAAKYDVRGWKNTVVFDPGKTGKIEVEKSGANETLGYKSFTEVVVQRKGSEDFAAILNNHIVPTIEDKSGEFINPLRLSYAKQQMDAVASRAQYFIGQGIPTIVCADWNISNSTAAGAELQQWLAEYGLGSAQALRGPFNTHGDREIDDQYSGGPIVTGSMWRLGDPDAHGYAKDGSDHNQIVVNYDPQEGQDMASWTLAPSLIELRDEINENWPLRDKTSDGSLGNAAHSARLSDHNPNGKRVVCAIDVDEDLLGSKASAYPRFNSGAPAKQILLDVLIKLAREGKINQAHYFIYERKIYQKKNNWNPAPYSGPNAHEHHLHISVEQVESLWVRRAPWGITKALPKFLPVYVVDPARVSTHLIANGPEGKDDLERKPGFRITTGVEIDGKWLVTQSGYRYHTDYLVLESALKVRITPAKVTAAPANFKPGKYVTTAVANGHKAADAQSEVVVKAKPAGTVVDVAAWAGENDGHLWVKDTMGRFWNFRSLRFGT